MVDNAMFGVLAIWLAALYEIFLSIKEKPRRQPWRVYPYQE
jgi:hypothetical protein